MSTKRQHPLTRRPHFPPDVAAYWRGKWRGQRCMILANGPSLPADDVLWTAYSAPVIGTNRSYLRWPSYIHVLVDKRLTGEIDLARETPQAVLRLSNYTVSGAYSPRRIHWSDAKRKDKYLYDIADSGWVVCGVSPCALQVAVWLGFTEIVFCGLDLTDARGRHFYAGGYKAEIPFSEQIDYFRRVKPELDRRGIRVINTCLDSAEDVFEKRAFEDMFP